MLSCGPIEADILEKGNKFTADYILKVLEDEKICEQTMCAML
jgi:hypothetical protein